MTLDELLEKHPAPWTMDEQGNFIDSNSVWIQYHCDKRTLIKTINHIHEMRGEMDAMDGARQLLQDDFVAVCGERDELKAENERLAGIVNRETNLRRDVHVENERLKARNEHLKDDVEKWRRKCDDATSSRDKLAAENAALRALESENKRLNCSIEIETHHRRTVDNDNDVLKAKVAELEASRDIQIRMPDAVGIREQRRFEAACAFAATGKHNSLSCVTDADALLAALDKPEPRGPSDIIYGLMAIKKELAANQRFSAAAKMRDIVAWIMVDYSDSFDWPAFECDDESPEPPAAEVWRIDEGRSRVDNMFQWFIENTDDGEYSFEINFAERHLVNRIVSALNKEQSC